MPPKKTTAPGAAL
jgi:hypothetical protein